MRLILYSLFRASGTVSTLAGRCMFWSAKKLVDYNQAHPREVIG